MLLTEYVLDEIAVLVAFRTALGTAYGVIVMAAEVGAGFGEGATTGDGVGVTTGAATTSTTPTATQAEIFCHSSVACANRVYLPTGIVHEIVVSLVQIPSVLVPLLRYPVSVFLVTPDPSTTL